MTPMLAGKTLDLLKQLSSMMIFSEQRSYLDRESLPGQGTNEHLLNSLETKWISQHMCSLLKTSLPEIRHTHSRMPQQLGSSRPHCTLVKDPGGLLAVRVNCLVHRCETHAFQDFGQSCYDWNRQECGLHKAGRAG